MSYLISLYRSKSGSPAPKITAPPPDICMGLLLGDLFPAGPGEVLRERSFVTQHYRDTQQNDNGTKL